MIIGVTGKNCAGKDTVADYLQKKSFYHHSLSDAIRDHCKKNKIKITIENLILQGNLLREKFGSSVLAQRTLDKIHPDRHFVISSIRNPSEVELLEEKSDFLLISIESSQKSRYERMKARNREGDPSTYEEFVTTEQIQESSNDPTKQQLLKCIDMAKVNIVNDGTEEELYEQINKVLIKWMPKIQSPRPSWDEYFMRLALVAALRGNCMKRKVAAVIVRDNRVISTGYNGTPKGVKNCNEGGCKRCNGFASIGTSLDECCCSHGEENAIVQASYHGVSVKDSNIYTILSPCLMCTKMIINAGIKEVIYNVEYPLPEINIKLFKQAKVKLRQFKIDDLLNK